MPPALLMMLVIRCNSAALASVDVCPLTYGEPGGLGLFVPRCDASSWREGVSREVLRARYRSTASVTIDRVVKEAAKISARKKSPASFGERTMKLLID